MKAIIGLSLVVGSALLLAGCSGPQARPATTSSDANVASPAAPSTEELAEYFGAIAGANPDEQRAVAAELTAPGSNAYAYAIEQAAVNQALMDSGAGTDAPSKLNTLTDGFELCDSDLISGEETYADGKLSDFDAGGSPLAGRLSLGDGSAIKLGKLATAELIAAYTSIAGDLYVVFEIKSKTDEFSIDYDTTYLAPDGRQASVTSTIAPSELSSGALANYAFIFEGASFGGKLKLKGYDANYNEVSAEVPIS